MKPLTVTAWGLLMGGMLLAGCNSGGGGVPAAATGFAMPTEISAVPADSSSSLKAKLIALGAAADAGTDYSNATTTKFVNEHTLEQFEIIEQILQAIDQTNYADAANVNQGPYKAMVAFQDEQNGIETKKLEPWIVDSALITENGLLVNRLRAWIDEVDNGVVRTIKAEVKIYTPATQASDGSYTDYGVWTINAKFDETGSNYFAASASVGTNGETILKIHENMAEGPGFTHEVKAVLNKSATTGFGKVSYPDWSACTQPNCTPSTADAKYAYNTTHLAVQNGADPVQYKDRTSVTELVNRYGMFDSVTGDDVLRTKSFGFPVRYTDSAGLQQFAYYGAWQGRHQLWANGGTVPDNTTVTRQDRGPNQTAESYTTVSFTGTLTKRTLVDADITDVQDLPFETWVNQNSSLVYDSVTSQWYECQDPPTCNTVSSTAFDLSRLIVDPNNNRKFVDINGFDLQGFPPGQPVRLAYDPDGTTTPHTQGVGFYAVQGFPPNVTHTNTFYTPADGNQIWVNIGGSIYIEYQGEPTGWVEKELVNFDTRTWTPEFGTDDRPYTLELNREYYINNQGANLIVKRIGSSTYDVKIELQTVANPANYATMLSGIDHFRAQWGNNEYGFEIDPTNSAFLKLRYVSGADNQGNPVTAGDVVTDGQWGLIAVDAGGSDILDAQSRSIQFNWEYPRDGETWGVMTYLVESGGNYKLLDDPIALAPVTLTNGAGDSKTLSLQYDGWMHGLPNLFEELRKSDFVVTQAIADKIISIPAGTEVTDATDSSKHYLVKPLEVSQFLEVVSDPGNLNITDADSVDLASVPVFVEHGMGAAPSVTGIKYSEGNLLE
jgi:hypothetical protein